MTLTFSRTSIYNNCTFILTANVLLVFCEFSKENRSFRFCEIVTYRDLTFTLQGITLTSYNQTLSTCASLCVGLIGCTWFTYNIHLTKCLILNIPTFQNVGSGTIELDTRHYAFRYGKSYT